VSENLVPTPVGTARITWYPARGSARAVALLGHGSVTGIESADLQALAAALPPRGVTVALVTQPYRLEANPGAVLATSMTRITAAVSSWIDSQLA
jgi:predicted alpha/beta-hydrolase family hydrolase